MARKKRHTLRDIIVTNDNTGNSLGSVSYNTEHWIFIDQKSSVVKMDDENDNTMNNRPLSEIYYETFLDQIRPTIRILQAIGFYPGCLTKDRKCIQGRCFQSFLSLYTLTLIAINFIIFGYTAFVMYSFKQAFGTLHALTIASIITGVKPLVNFLNLSIFLKNCTFHGKLLRQCARTNEMFRENFGCQPNIKTLNSYVKTCFMFAFLIPFAFRIFEYVYMEESFGTDWMADLSLAVVPFLTLWGVVPLIYFGYCFSFIQFWMHTLGEQLAKDKHLLNRPLKFYYRQFLNLTSICASVGYLFNPFIFFSFAWSVVILCLTIYFTTQAKSFVETPPASLIPDDFLEKWKDLVYFNIGWSGIQIGLAAFHMATICYYGIKVNEEARVIVKEVLALDFQEETESDRFQVTCFVHKICTQYTWGVSVWRAFPIERGVLFTLISLIITYAIILVKLKQSEPSCEYSTGLASEQFGLIGSLLNETMTLRDVVFGRFVIHSQNSSSLIP